MTACLLCGEPITGGQDTQPIGSAEGPQQAHRECLLRCVVGGIGHLVDHHHWCVARRDPDGGRTYRQSALEVDQWIATHGIAEAMIAQD